MMEISIPEGKNAEEIFQNAKSSPSSQSGSSTYGRGRGFNDTQLDQLFAIHELNGSQVSASRRDQIKRL